VLTADGQPFGAIEILAGAVTGQVQLEIPANTPPMTVTFRAVSGPTQAEVTVEITA
jgi:molybdopterin-binding protein